MLVRRRSLCSKSGRQREAPLVLIAFTKEFCSLLERVVLFLSSLGLPFFSFFSPKDFLPLLIFHEQRFFHKQRASTCEFWKVRDVKK